MANRSGFTEEFALRTWRAEALNAIICSPSYQSQRGHRTRELTRDLVSLFSIFHKDKDWSRACYSCQDDVIKPAIAFHEKLLTSTHHFHLDLNPLVFWDSEQELQTSPEFFDNLPRIKCQNILQNRKLFNLAKLDTQPTREELIENLSIVVTVSPALYMRQIGKGDTIKEPAIVRQQQVLVAWGGQEKREKFMADAERTILNRIYYAGRDKPERAPDRGLFHRKRAC